MGAVMGIARPINRTVTLEGKQHEDGNAWVGKPSDGNSHTHQRIDNKNKKTFPKNLTARLGLIRLSTS